MIRVKDMIDALLSVDGELLLAVENPYGTFDTFSARLEDEMRIVGDKLVLPSYGSIPEWEGELTPHTDEPPVIEEGLPPDDDDELHLTILGGGGG